MTDDPKAPQNALDEAWLNLPPRASISSDLVTMIQTFGNDDGTFEIPLADFVYQVVGAVIGLELYAINLEDRIAALEKKVGK